MNREYEAVAAVIYDHLHDLSIKTRPWADLSPDERAGWYVVARDAIAAYEGELVQAIERGEDAE